MPTITRLDSLNWEENRVVVEALTWAYSLDFWTQAWKELLAVRDVDDRVLHQYGTYDKHHHIYPETRALMEQCGLSETDPDWPVKLWTLAGDGKICDPQGRRVDQYWSLERSLRELRKFVGSIDEEGCGGEILVLMNDEGNVAGFSALTCQSGDVARKVAHRRYEVEQLFVPTDAPEARKITIEGILRELCPGDMSFGIFLDHAISEEFRGAGLGSLLFDARIDRLIALGAEVIFGRTSETAPPQYKGNYQARGLRPFAADVEHRDKHYFLANTSDLTPRRSKTDHKPEDRPSV